MAYPYGNLIYNNARQLFMEGSLHWLTDNIYAALLYTGTGTLYVPNASADLYLSTVYGYLFCDPVLLTLKTATGGVADAEDAVFLLAGPGEVDAIVIYKDEVIPGNSPLIAYIDTATTLPFTAGAGNISVSWDNGANKIFKL